MKGLSNLELEKRKADFCTKRCPHEDVPCTRCACEEYKQEFKVGEYSTRRTKKKAK